MDYIDPAQYPDTTRKGYLLKDLCKNFIQVLSESGAVATGKAMHFSSDFICSGNMQLFQNLCWDYAYDHIGTASPRIFYYLRRRFAELNEKQVKMNLDQFCRNPEVQEGIMEVTLILQMCPNKSRVKFPTVPQETLGNENWLRGVLRTTDKASVKKVYNQSTDQEQMLHGMNECIFAISEGALEKALFWTRWLITEDAEIRKQLGSGLSTQERGPLTSKQRTHVGYYIINVLVELYKEFVLTFNLRAHEEIDALVQIYRDTATSQKHKNDIITMIIQMLIDMPRQKVPACPSLVSDPATLQRILQNSKQFFDEILRLPPLSKPLPTKVSGLKAKKVKDKTKQSELEDRLAAIDAATMNFLKL